MARIWPPRGPARRLSSVYRRLDTGTARWVFARHGSGPPLLLIHGLSGSVRWWRRNVPSLAQHFTVFAVELQGFAGNRGRPLPPSESARALQSFTAALEIERAHLVGHSMGGQICLHFAAAYPQQVDRLVLIAPSGMLRRGLAYMAARLALSTRYGAPDFLPTVAFDAVRAGPINLLRAARSLLKDDVSSLLGAVRAPTLVLAGEKDLLVPPMICRAIAAGIPGASFLELKGAGHNLMWDRASAFDDALASFLLPPLRHEPAAPQPDVAEVPVDPGA